MIFVEILLFFALIVLLAFLVLIRRPPGVKLGRAEEKIENKTYLFSGQDGSYWWYLAELLRADGFRPASGSVDGFYLRGSGPPPKCTYYHSMCDSSYNYTVDDTAVSCKYANDAALDIEEYVLTGRIIRFYFLTDTRGCSLYNDHGFILGGDSVRVFPAEYNGDAGKIIRQLGEIYEETTRSLVANAGYRLLALDLRVAEDDKCELGGIQYARHFYNMPPEGEYAKAMRGLTEWMYKTAIRPHLQ